MTVIHRRRRAPVSWSGSFTVMTLGDDDFMPAAGKRHRQSANLLVQAGSFRSARRSFCLLQLVVDDVRDMLEADGIGQVISRIAGARESIL